MDEREIFPRHRLRLGESSPVDMAARHQLRGNQSVFRGWPHMATQVQLVVPRKNNWVQS
jgi:hypothetical protein